MRIKNLKSETYKDYNIDFAKYPDGMVVGKITGQEEVFTGHTKSEVLDKIKNRIDVIEDFWDSRRHNKKYYTIDEVRRLLV